MALLGCARLPTAAELPIIDGAPATSEERFGTVAVLWDQGMAGGICTGTLISPSVVVTAAHCVVLFDETTGARTRTATLDELAVVDSALDIRDATDAQIHEVQRIAVHPGFPRTPLVVDGSGIGQWDDVAVLVLRDSVRAQRPVAILSQDRFEELVAEGSTVIISGYGRTDLADEGSIGELHIARASVRGWNRHEILIGGRGEPNACFGDSGGPTYLETSGGLFVIGAASRAPQSSPTAAESCRLGAVQTLLPYYATWIEEAVPPP